MTFKSLYGLSHLLTEYGIANKGVKVADKSEITRITSPFLAQTRSGAFVIVTDIDSGKGTISYDSYGEAESTDLEKFKAAWNGIALLAFPDKSSAEPDVRSHRITELVEAGSKYALAVAALAVFVWFFVTRRVYADVSTVLVAVLDCVGLYLSFLLMQKSLHIHTSASERVCSILEKGGCDEIVADKASKLFGVFSWSEVGFGYFSVSLATLLLFPHLWSQLAICNACCLPYSFWSIWYQKYKAHHWCTLCVGVQATLWLKFFCWLGGGWPSRAFPINADFLILVAVYVFAVLAINLIVRIFKNLPKDEKNT